MEYRVIDDFWHEPEELEAVLAEWPETGWTQKACDTSYKRSISYLEHMPPTACGLFTKLASRGMLQYMEHLMDIRPLYAVTMEGGGLHDIPPGGFLGIHVDFNQFAGMRRAVNLLLYLNHDWWDEWGGHLELWSEGATKLVDRIAPEFNRAVIFKTGEESWHGHPRPHAAPHSRKSLAMYYYTDGEVESSHTTIYL